MVERAPVNDYAHFCLGGRWSRPAACAEARRHAALAAACARTARTTGRSGPAARRLNRQSALDPAQTESTRRLEILQRGRDSHSESPQAPFLGRGAGTPAPPPRPPPPGPSRRSSSRSSTAARQVGVHPDLAFDCGAGEAREARRAVPPQQHPRVDAVGGIERVGLRGEQAVGETQAHLQRPAAPPARRPRSRPTRRGPAGGTRRAGLHVVVDHVHRGHRDRVRSAACGRSSSG